MRKKKHLHNNIIEPYMKKIDDNLTKTQVKLIEIRAKVNQLERQLNRIEQYINGIYNRLTKLELETSFLVEREKEPMWKKIKRRIRELL